MEHKKGNLILISQVKSDKRDLYVAKDIKGKWESPPNNEI